LRKWVREHREQPDEAFPGNGKMNRHHFSRYSAAVRNAAFQTRLETAVH
jgi:hypothetical protein